MTVFSSAYFILVHRYTTCSPCNYLQAWPDSKCMKTKTSFDYIWIFSRVRHYYESHEHGRRADCDRDLKNLCIVDIGNKLRTDTVLLLCYVLEAEKSEFHYKLQNTHGHDQKVHILCGSARIIINSVSLDRKVIALGSPTPVFSGVVTFRPSHCQV